MIPRVILRATLVGAVLQVAMVMGGHVYPPMKEAFMVGGLLFSLIAGIVYVRTAGGGWPDSLVGGTVSGALCALIGLAISASLGDVPPATVAFGTVGSAVAGLVGGALGRAISQR